MHLRTPSRMHFTAKHLLGLTTARPVSACSVSAHRAQRSSSSRQDREPQEAALTALGGNHVVNYMVTKQENYEQIPV